ncbi:hypothetical protein Vretimale_10411, partial [Volvox reticuliferus]
DRNRWRIIRTVLHRSACGRALVLLTGMSSLYRQSGHVKAVKTKSLQVLLCRTSFFSFQLVWVLLTFNSKCRAAPGHGRHASVLSQNVLSSFRKYDTLRLNSHMLARFQGLVRTNCRASGGRLRRTLWLSETRTQGSRKPGHNLRLMATKDGIPDVARAVLEYWFGPNFETADDSFVPRDKMQIWFRGTPDVDQYITEHFGRHVQHVSEGLYDSWREGSPLSLLAGIILMDQFSRNIYRGTPGAFALDRKALSWADYAVESGADKSLPAMLRYFAYMPYMHAEDLAAQEVRGDARQCIQDDHVVGGPLPLAWSEPRGAARGICAHVCVYVCVYVWVLSRLVCVCVYVCICVYVCRIGGFCFTRGHYLAVPVCMCFIPTPRIDGITVRITIFIFLRSAIHPDRCNCHCCRRHRHCR